MAAYASPLENLTPRQLAIVRLVAEGYSNKEIARRDQRTVNTVKHHIKGAMAALGVHNRTEMAVVYITWDGDGLADSRAAEEKKEWT